MRSAIALLLLVALPSGAAAHDFHVTLAEVEWAREDGALEVALRIDTADLEQELDGRTPPGTDVPVLESAAADSALVELLAAEFVLTDREGAAAPPQWVGKEIGPAVTWLYFRLRVAGGLEGLRLRQGLGLDRQPRQVNTVQMRDGDRRWTLVFDRAHPERDLVGEPSVR